MQNGAATLESSFPVSQMVIELPYDPLLGIYLKEMKTYIHRNTGTRMFIAVLFIITKKWAQLKCPLTEELKKNVAHSHSGILFSHRRE